MGFIAFSTLLYVAAAQPQLSASGSWTYNAQDQWPEVCGSGQKQSPIDLRTDDADRVNVTELRFHHCNTTGPFNVTGDGKSGTF